MVRRTKHEGTVYKYRTGWAAQVDLGVDPGTGKRIRRTVYGRTREEAREKLFELKKRGG